MAADELPTDEGGLEEMRLMTRMIVALAVTVLAALALYFVFLNGNRPARDDAASVQHVVLVHE